jgi:hypothetical protein
MIISLGLLLNEAIKAPLMRLYLLMESGVYLELENGSLIKLEA